MSRAVFAPHEFYTGPQPGQDFGRLLFISKGGGNVVEVKMTPIAELKPHPKNPRVHPDSAIDKLTRSIKEFGWTNPVLVSKEGYILAGHARIKAAQRAGMSEVPVIMLPLEGARADAYLIADNRLQEETGWDMPILTDLINQLKFDDVDLSLTGFEPKEIEKLIHSIFDSGLEEQDADAPVDTPRTRTKMGDLWQLGQHRLICGDSSEIETVEYLLGESKPGTMVFDPPWDAAVAATKPKIDCKNILVFTDGRRIGDSVGLFGPPTWLFVWDCVTSWYTSNRPLQRGKLCLWYGNLGDYDADGSHYGQPDESMRVISNTRGTYKYIPDPRGKHLSDVFQRQITKEHADGMHPHSKPVDWMRMLLANCTAGEIYDPFAGSGTTLIAAEQLGRKCHLIEIDPQYCDLILERWEQMVGKDAVLVANRLDRQRA
jgi:hypothetical protein